VNVIRAIQTRKCAQFSQGAKSDQHISWKNNSVFCFGLTTSKWKIQALKVATFRIFYNLTKEFSHMGTIGMACTKISGVRVGPGLQPGIWNLCCSVEQYTCKSGSGEKKNLGELIVNLTPDMFVVVSGQKGIGNLWPVSTALKKRCGVSWSDVTAGDGCHRKKKSVSGTNFNILLFHHIILVSNILLRMDVWTDHLVLNAKGEN
jgi:hypothetical protein